MNELAVQQGNDGGLRELALFAGAGGGILGGHLLGWRTVCAVEWDAYAASVLVARQNDGCLPPFPIWDDVQTFDGRPWRGRVDIVSGGFPCQDISAAGKGAGITGQRSGMWSHMARIVGEVRPRFVWVENSPLLVSRGLDTVLADLAALGYDARWGVVGANNKGAPHDRERIWIKAFHPDSQYEHSIREVSGEGQGTNPGGVCPQVSNANSQHEQGVISCILDEKRRGKQGERPARSCGDGTGWWATEPELGRVAHGVAYRVDRLRCIGNGQVPAVARLAWETLR